MTERTLVTIATYNEKENIEALLEGVLEQLPEANVLVIDDGSPDGTGELVDRFADRDERVRCLHREGKLGLGTAILAGMEYAKENDYTHVLNMDADFSHHPRYLPAMVQAMKDADVVIGSRYVEGGGVVGWDWRRKFMSWGINVYSRLLLRLKPRDTSGAFRCYRVAKLREIDFDRVYSRGYSFQEEFLYRCRRVGCRIIETPIVFEDRKKGQSKIDRKEALLALWCLFVVALRG